MRLHIGGKPIPGWKTLDVQAGPGVDYVADCSDLSVFEDESVDEIYASHVMEHLSYVDKLPQAFREFHRVLKPGGRARISVPDFAVLCWLFTDPRRDGRDRFHLMRIMFGGQVDASDFHCVGITYEFMTEYLAGAGFTRLERVPEFGLVEGDSSSQRFDGTLISLNVIAYK